MQVGQRDEVAVQEGQARVVVLEVQRLPHSGGELVDEAEDALVLAGVLSVHQRRFKIQSDIVVFALMNDNLKRTAVPHQSQPHLGIGKEKAVVQHVGDLAPVDCAEKVSRAHSVAVCAAPSGHFCYFHHPGIILPDTTLQYSIIPQIRRFVKYVFVRE